MKKLFIKQKIMSLRGRFTVKDEQERDIYFVEGSFLQIPKHYTITSKNGEEIAIITKKILSLLPTFFVEQAGKEVATIRKEFSLFKARYNIEAQGLTVNGNWWDLNFDIIKNGEVVAHISKAWLSWGDSYAVEIYDDALEAIIISIVIAIDCVKADAQSATS